MATNRDLLKEAIADAKAVKEMAIANAKAALEESFTPFLREKLSAKITEMDNEKELEEAGFGGMDPREKTSHGNVEEELYEDDDTMDLNDLFTELNEAEDDSEDDESDNAEEKMGDDEDMSDEPIDPDDLTDAYIEDIVLQVLNDMGVSGEVMPIEDETEETEKTPEIEDETEEINIDELLAEIAAMNDETLYGDDLDGMSMDNDGMSMDGMGPLDEDASFFLDADGVASTAQAIASMAAAAGGVGLAYLAAWWKNKAAAKKSVSKAEVTAAAKEAEKREETGDKSGAKKELAEAYRTIKSLRSDLNEINLLNAKLLYTNKIFKAKNLTEGQKVNVLSTFDKATTVKEVKLVFETLNEGLKVKTASPIRENLGSASRNVGTTKTKKPIVESNDMVSRFQKLAGII
jgi:hypothetical protein